MHQRQLVIEMLWCQLKVERGVAVKKVGGEVGGYSSLFYFANLDFLELGIRTTTVAGS